MIKQRLTVYKFVTVLGQYWDRHTNLHSALFSPPPPPQPILTSSYLSSSIFIASQHFCTLWARCLSSATMSSSCRALRTQVESPIHRATYTHVHACTYMQAQHNEACSICCYITVGPSTTHHTHTHNTPTHTQDMMHASHTHHIHTHTTPPLTHTCTHIRYDACTPHTHKHTHTHTHTP